MTLFVILLLIIIAAVLLGALHYTLKQPSSQRKILKRCVYISTDTQELAVEALISQLNTLLLSAPTLMQR